MEKILTEVYNFSILPYALGDVITWNMKASARVLEMGGTGIDVVLVADPEEPANEHQKRFITPETYQAYLLDLLPVFYSNPMLRSLTISPVAVPNHRFDAVVSTGRQVQKVINFWEGINSVLRSEISCHDDLYRFHKDQHKLPELTFPKGSEVLFHPGSVAVDIRTRSGSTKMDLTEPDREADLLVWEKVFKALPTTAFYILGRGEGKAGLFMDCPNVVHTRKLGMDLANEMFLMHTLPFIGTLSGFAMYAIYGKQPYIIARVLEGARKNLGLQGGSDLPWIQPKQTFLYGAENADMIISCLEDVL
jgi:hypothetical protein